MAVAVCSDKEDQGQDEQAVAGKGEQVSGRRDGIGLTGERAVDASGDRRDDEQRCSCDQRKPGPSILFPQKGQPKSGGHEEGKACGEVGGRGKGRHHEDDETGGKEGANHPCDGCRVNSHARPVGTCLWIMRISGYSDRTFLAFRVRP